MGQKSKVQGKRMPIHILPQMAAWVATQFRQPWVRQYSMACGILTYYLGPEWVRGKLEDRNVSGFLNVRHKASSSPEFLDNYQYRAVSLCEMLLNLQHVEGFDCCLTQLRTDSVEATYAELETGFLLTRYGLPFRFVEPIGKAGHDFDIEILLADGQLVCGDTKARLFTSKLTEESILEQLQNAQKKLPANRPSFIFYRMPPYAWQPNNDSSPAIEAAVKRLFGSTKRVASVKVHTHQIAACEGGATSILLAKEYSNPNCRWTSPIGWDLFSKAATNHKWLTLHSMLGYKESLILSGIDGLTDQQMAQMESLVDEITANMPR